MLHPLVSILIPFKNTEEFFSECLQSIVEQEYQNWEVLAVDDHSSDKSSEIAQLFADDDERINLFQNRGDGIIEALKTAYSKSKGQLITRMDSDDIMPAKKTKTMALSLVAHGKDHLAIGQVTYFSEPGIGDGYKRYEKWLNSLTKNGTNYSEIYKECVIPSPCWMVYREDLDHCGAFEPNRYPEDYDLAFRFYEKGLQIIPCNQVLHLWRDYDTRTSRTDEHYAQNYFLNIKLHYFLKLNHNTAKPLTLWGAGNKGKEIAKKLLEQNIDFYWLCDNPKKIGKFIYGKKMFHFSKLVELNPAQSIITVANEDAQTMIRRYVLNLGLQNMKDFFFFC
ncbi:MAG: glycosyltransferase family 2 protein [Flavobacteriaceae bacterium]